MKYGLLIGSILLTAAFVVSAHFGARAYFQTRQLKTQIETMTFRTRLMKQQVGELEQKMRVVRRVNSFVDHARQLGLTPDHWDPYDVSIQDALTFKELAVMVEQCVHNKELYYHPQSFHIAVGRKKIPGEQEALPAVPAAAPGTDQKPADLTLNMKGTFWVRH